MTIKRLLCIFWFVNLETISTKAKRSSGLFQVKSVRIDQIEMEKVLAVLESNSQIECALLCKQHSKCEKSAIMKDNKCYLLNDEDFFADAQNGKESVVVIREILPKMLGNKVPLICPLIF